MDGISFDEWLEQTDGIRAKLEAHSATPLPVDAGERHMELEKSIAYEDYAAVLVADIEFYVTMETEKAYMNLRPDLTAKTGEVIVKAKVASLVRLKAKIAATAKTMHSRMIASMSENRAGR